MMHKSMLIPAFAALLTAGAVSTPASAHDDPVLGALTGAAVGALIGHGLNGHNGAAIGSAVGAVAGAAIAASADGHYDSGYYRSMPSYGAAIYDEDAPGYYVPPVVVNYEAPWVYRHYDEARLVRYGHDRDWHEARRHDGGHGQNHDRDVHERR